MNKNDIVKLINLTDTYKQNNLYLDVRGIVLEYNNEKSKILFLNEYNQGDYAFLEVENRDVEIISDDVSPSFINYIKDNFESFILEEKGFKKKDFKAYSQVELLVEDAKYSKSGVHKGDKGVIVEEYAVKDYILVDFGRLDEDNNYCGDYISVKLKDIKILK